MAIEMLAQIAREVPDAKETNETRLYLVDGMSSQERMRKYYQVPHLLKNDAAIEWVAWLAVLGLLFTAIRLVGTL